MEGVSSNSKHVIRTLSVLSRVFCSLSQLDTPLSATFFVTSKSRPFNLCLTRVLLQALVGGLCKMKKKGQVMDDLVEVSPITKFAGTLTCGSSTMAMIMTKGLVASQVGPDVAEKLFHQADKDKSGTVRSMPCLGRPSASWNILQMDRNAFTSVVEPAFERSQPRYLYCASWWIPLVYHLTQGWHRSASLRWHITWANFRRYPLLQPLNLHLHLAAGSSDMLLPLMCITATC